MFLIYRANYVSIVYRTEILPEKDLIAYDENGSINYINFEEIIDFSHCPFEFRPIFNHIPLFTVTPSLYSDKKHITIFRWSNVNINLFRNRISRIHFNSILELKESEEKDYGFTELLRANKLTFKKLNLVDCSQKKFVNAENMFFVYPKNINNGIGYIADCTNVPETYNYVWVPYNHPRWYFVYIIKETCTNSVIKKFPGPDKTEFKTIRDICITFNKEFN